MFDHAHYVPVLRWKRGERGALKALDPIDKAAMTPLIELLPGYMRPRRAKGSYHNRNSAWERSMTLLQGAVLPPLSRA